MNNGQFDDLESLIFNINSEEECNIRIDKYLSSKLENVSRNYVQELIEEKYVFVNNNNVKSSYKLQLNDEIIVYFKPISTLDVLPENIPLDIVYEDEDIVIVNKSAGMVVHPSPGHYEHTLVNALLYHIKNLSAINGVYRPGIVHRLDMDTSGLIAIAKNDYAHNFLVEQLKDHSMQRTYVCLVRGILESNKGIIKTLIGRDKKNRLKMAVVNDNGKEAITEFKVIQLIAGKYSLVECKLKTGRTHQIRVHMNFIKHPIINDPLYGDNNKIPFESCQLLHACRLTLTHPRSKETMTFEAKIPENFQSILEQLDNNK